MKSYFIEGLQGAGKSTYVSMLEKQFSEQGYTAYREGDYSPVELALEIRKYDQKGDYHGSSY